MLLPDYLTIPLLAQERDPQATDFRQILRWSLGVPRLTYAVTVGTQPPANLEPLMTLGSFAGTPSAGILTIPITGYSYGYIPLVVAGDSVTLGAVLPTLATSTRTHLTVLCYTPSGTLVSGSPVRVNYQLIGA